MLMSLRPALGEAATPLSAPPVEHFGASSGGAEGAPTAPESREGAYSRSSWTSRGPDSLPVDPSLGSAPGLGDVWAAWLVISTALAVATVRAAASLCGAGLWAAAAARLPGSSASPWWISFTLSSTLLQYFFSFLSSMTGSLPKPFLGFSTMAISFGSSLSKAELSSR